VADNRIWLDVAFAEKDEAKAHGARWDQTARRWYAPRPGMTALDRWQAWELDLSILVRAGVAVTKPPSVTERADLPSKILRRN